MSGWVRAAGLHDLVSLLDELGIDGAGLLAGYGLSTEVLADPDALVPICAAAEAGEAAAAETARPDLGLLLAERQSLRVIGPLSLAVQSASTLGEALAVASRYLFTHSPMMSIRAGPDPAGEPGLIGVYFDSQEPPLPTVPQSADSAIGLLHRVILELHGPYPLRSVHLPHPALAPAVRYESFFGAPIRFNCDHAALRVPSDIASRALRSSDHLLNNVALQHLRTNYPAPVESFSAAVRAVVSARLSGGDTTLAGVAQQLGVHARTLQRRLAAEGTRFDEVLDASRREKAHHLLTRTDLPMNQVAAGVGLSEQSALARATRRWFGATPRAVRGKSLSSGANNSSRKGEPDRRA
jgi:AraC-like DNA-binding protein